MTDRLDLDALLAKPQLRGTRWSIQVRELGEDGGSHVVLEHQPTLLLPTASVGKLFLLVEVAAQLADGRLSQGATVRREAVPLVADSGLWQHLEAPTLSVHDATALVGAVSDNHAANVLLTLLGLDVVQSRAAVLAAGGSSLLDLVRVQRGPQDPPALSIGCADDLCGLAASLATGMVVSRAVSEQVERWLAAGTDLSMVASAFALDPLAHTSSDAGAEDAATHLWCKTGTNSGVRADVGVLTRRTTTGRRRVAYAVLCAWDPAEPTAPRPGGVLAAMHAIGHDVERVLDEA